MKPTGTKAISVAMSIIANLLAPAITLAGVDTNVFEVCAKSTDAALRAKYCSAAKDLKKGYLANIATSAVWTGVSVTCGAACGKALGGMVCKLAGMGGSAGEGVITKKFSDSLVGQGTKWEDQTAGGKDTVSTGTSVTEATNVGKVNTDACQTSATSALKAYGKYSDSKQTDKSLAQLRDQTKEMNTEAQNTTGFVRDTPTSGGGNGPSTSAAAADTSDVCNEAALRTALGALRCASSADPNLPAYVKSEEFLKDLQKATGKSPDAFFAGFESPAKSIFDSPVVNGLSEGQQRGLADSLSAMETYSDKKTENSAAKSPSSSSASGYTAEGARHKSSDEDAGFDVNGVIANVLGQLGAEGKGGTEIAGNPLTADRKPATSAGSPEDRKVSIFDRVQWRYGAVTARDRLGAK